MTFESEGLLIVAIYIWLPPASYVVFSDNSGLLKSSHRLYPLMYIKMLETVCIPPLTSLICEIKTLLILWKYQVILVIAYIFIIKVINYAP